MNSQNANPTSANQRFRGRDLTCGPSGILLWCLPALALIVGLDWTAARVWLWIPAFLIMGVACLANASRCGRLHCYLSGPILLLAAAYVALASVHAIPFAPVALLDAVSILVVLAFLAEIPFGRYRTHR
ncbi:MAG TPA: hypothetical protein VKS44_13170 [Candidatus Acidoferrales bacterium]|nr:hypothetical protein [Candidatus Acidoferrales bacterium]